MSRVYWCTCLRKLPVTCDSEHKWGRLTLKIILGQLCLHTDVLKLFSPPRFRQLKTCQSGLFLSLNCDICSSSMVNAYVCHLQCGSNMTGTNAACLHTNQSRSYLNHLVLRRSAVLFPASRVVRKCGVTEVLSLSRASVTPWFCHTQYLWMSTMYQNYTSNKKKKVRNPQWSTFRLQNGIAGYKSVSEIDQLAIFKGFSFYEAATALRKCWSSLDRLAFTSVCGVIIWKSVLPP